MKKFILSAALLSLSFLTFSFKSADKSNGDYDVQTDLSSLDTGLAASFTASKDNAKDPDETWSIQHKTWDLTSTGSDVEALDKVLSDL